MNKPDILGVIVNDEVALRITADGDVLLKKKLTVEALRATVTDVANNLVTMHSTTLLALQQALGDSPPNGDCGCPGCNLRRLRDLLSNPVLH